MNNFLYLKSLIFLFISTTAGAFQLPVQPFVIKNSPFGPRINNGKYDFHRGLDVNAVAGQPVYAIDDGIVKIANDLYIVIEITSGEFSGKAFRYVHVTPTVMINQSVSEGAQIATIQAQGALSHLDIKLYEDASKFDDAFFSVHPGRALSMDLGSFGSRGIPSLSSLSINPVSRLDKEGEFIEASYSISRKSFLVERVSLTLSAQRFPDFLLLDQTDILRQRVGDPDLSKIGVVDYSQKINCGDYTTPAPHILVGDYDNSDDGFIKSNGTIRIEPGEVEADPDGFQHVFFKFYLKDDLPTLQTGLTFGTLEIVTANSQTFRTVELMNPFVAICETPPCGAPGSPQPTASLVMTATSNFSDMSIDLSWNASGFVPDAATFLVRRRKLGEPINNLRLIATVINNLNQDLQNFKDYLQTSPGTTYIYSISGSSIPTGEGTDSEIEIGPVQATMPSSGIVNSDRTWIGDILINGNVVINSGVTLTVATNSIVNFDPLNSPFLYVNGTLSAMFCKFKSTIGGSNWGGIQISNPGTLFLIFVKFKMRISALPQTFLQT